MKMKKINVDGIKKDLLRISEPETIETDLLNMGEKISPIINNDDGDQRSDVEKSSGDEQKELRDDIRGENSAKVAEIDTNSDDKDEMNDDVDLVPLEFEVGKSRIVGAVVKNRK